MVNIGSLMAEIVWWVLGLGTPANFNCFCVLASLLHQFRSTEVNHTLHDVWQSPGLIHYIYIFGSFCPIMEFCQVQNPLCVEVLHYPILAVLLHGTWAVGVSQTLQHGIFTRHGGHSVWHSAVELSSFCSFYILALSVSCSSSSFLCSACDDAVYAMAQCPSVLVLCQNGWPVVKKTLLDGRLNCVCLAL